MAVPESTLWSYGDVRLTRLHDGGALILVNWDTHKFVDHIRLFFHCTLALHLLLRIEVDSRGSEKDRVPESYLQGQRFIYI